MSHDSQPHGARTVSKGLNGTENIQFHLGRPYMGAVGLEAPGQARTRLKLSRASFVNGLCCPLEWAEVPPSGAQPLLGQPRKKRPSVQVPQLVGAGQEWNPGGTLQTGQATLWSPAEKPMGPLCSLLSSFPAVTSSPKHLAQPRRLHDIKA